MPTKSATLLASLFLFVGLGLSKCTYQASSSAVSDALEHHFATLSAMDQPVKVVTDTASRWTFWLNFVGEIYRMRPDGSAPERIIGGIGANRSTFFIQDFCVDSPNNRIVFTDLRDSRTGHGAIKQASLSGTRVSTLVSLPNETPYQVSADARTGRLYYLTEESRKPHSVYRLRTPDQEDALLVSSTKIQSLLPLPEAESDGIDNTAAPIETLANADR